MLVCGLGQLGVACLAALRGYHVPVFAVDLRALDPGSGVARITVGDFRNLDVLRAAGVARCRAVLFVAGDANTNMQGALAARHLSPAARIVVRSEQQTCYTLLARELGDFVAYTPHRLAAASFALAALDSEVVAHFYVRDRLFQVVEHVVGPGDPKLDHSLHSAENIETRVLLHVPADGEDPAPLALQRWRPEATVAAGDRMFLLTARAPLPLASDPSERHASSYFQRLRRLAAIARDAWRPTSQEAKITLAGLFTLSSLLVLSLLIFRQQLPEESLGGSLRTSLLLLLSNGHLADVFERHEALTPGLRWLEIILTCAGTILTAVLYALLTNRLLAARFQLLSRRPKPAARGHVLIAGLGRAGQETARFLEQLGRSAVAVEKEAIEPYLLPRLPVVRADATDPSGLAHAHVAEAAGVVAATGEDLVNVEIGLTARQLSPGCGLVVRLIDQQLIASVAALLPHAQVLCISSLAATAFAAAALGEHVSHVFQLQNTSVLVTEYRISESDTFHGRFLWEVAEGYGVVPILLERPDSERPLWNVEDSSIRLCAGDKLVVLATAASLEAIERGELLPRSYELRIERVLPFAETLQVVGVLSRNLDYTLVQAHALLRETPVSLPDKLYPIHALRTKHLLETNGVQVSVHERA